MTRTGPYMLYSAFNNAYLLYQIIRDTCMDNISCCFIVEDGVSILLWWPRIIVANQPELSSLIKHLEQKICRSGTFKEYVLFFFIFFYQSSSDFVLNAQLYKWLIFLKSVSIEYLLCERFKMPKNSQVGRNIY